VESDPIYQSERWDIFCRVVDNYGDVGVAWRLARLLAGEHGKRVRLWLDDPAVLALIRPEVDAARERQALEGVEIRRWSEAFRPEEIADVVVETFGCDPPAGYVAAMALRTPRPRWVNLEYLSAEDWVEGSHALPSPHPRLPLVKHYFFPGFTARTGGLLCESGLLARREAFQADAAAQSAFWRSLARAEPPAGTLRVSVFAYRGAPVESLLDALERQSQPAWCVLPERGRAAHAIESRGSLQVVRAGFLHQDRYDTLLWACDLNFVRGEDSFVRAQWAARPLVWNIYPQEQGAHWVKLSAFVGRYTAGLEREDAAAVGALWEAWNRGEDMVQPWAGYVARRERLEVAARAWAERLGSRKDLAAELVEFVDKMLK
jgi:uncharacterized repeat protein (TIGR03837 family)